jgi:putative transposase
MVTPAAERKAVAHLVERHAMSERRACKAIGCCRMTVRYQSARPDDRALRERMIESVGGSAIGACMSCSSAKAMS